MEKSSTEKKIEIKPTGSYFNIDKDGFVINPASAEKIQEEWKPVIEDVIDSYKKLYKDKLKNVYIRGSVAKGEAVLDISDIDAFAYVDANRQDLPSAREERRLIVEKYPFIASVEMGISPLSEIPLDTIILNQSLCVYGEPIEVPKLKPGKEMAIHSPSFHNRFTKFENFLNKEDSEEEIKKDCVWFMKGLLRVGFEITMERSGRYTRDLYRCYETFAEYYPEKEVEMKEVLTLALNPTSDKRNIKKIMDNLGQWLLKEIPHYFDVVE